jgi:hypothetical protein
MKINQIASKPQLIKLTIEDAEIIKDYDNEPIEFWTYDRQPLETFMKLAAMNQENSTEIIDLIRTMILDEEGKQVIQGDVTLPTKVLMPMIAKIVETLGK